MRQQDLDVDSVSTPIETLWLVNSVRVLGYNASWVNIRESEVRFDLQEYGTLRDD